ncbi:FKBP-type peptidyl-prolyl cis-trans isomerase [Pedobacter sp. N36a]|uniref:FKBP-type peptidyl-prolyl cis-trans isomerase n=1 Tax=Pedobacter sp. N36a TaxID=2767996 RepID=UPI001656D5F9|nr:FKBP-type peptidyl-prolyl cis-trans isomerase [Pedobacter sp. N36a]MBC8986020.1 FKBP-type peptidyl-prolyl cis-trans isomerase [Pedobacter sp. N36a]
MLKNKILLLSFLLCGLFAACEKTPPYDPEKQLELDAITIQKYRDSTRANLTVDPSGLNYEILGAGTGTVFPKLQDSLVVYFDARVLKSALTFRTVPETDSVTVKLADAMQGWQIGLPKITKGGRIRLIIPSALAYKDFSGTNIPPRAILDYTITLKNIK